MKVVFNLLKTRNTYKLTCHWGLPAGLPPTCKPALWLRWCDLMILYMLSPFWMVSMTAGIPSYLKCWYSVKWLRFFRLNMGQTPPSFFSLRNSVLMNWGWDSWHCSITAISIIFCTSRSILAETDLLKFSGCGVLSCWGTLTKLMAFPWTTSKIQGVRIFQFFM